MTDAISPRDYPEKAAFQLVIELIRAERVPMHSTNVTNMLKMYDEALNHFKTKVDGDSSGFQVEVL
ncbi:ATP-NAD kinase [Erwinia aphidicola]|uniref:ATP-NAD kinase n=1 Tax=Erwinia aphidicola TaxID=68334 RepID=UPI00301A2CD0